MKLLTTIFAFLVCSISKGQTNYQGLLDTSIKFTGQLFVNVKPITKIQLEEDELWNYSSLFKDYAKATLDTIMLLQIIQNSKQLDTSLWSDKELSKFILVLNRNENVDLKYVVNKFQLHDKKKIRYYRKQVNHFNATENLDKNVYSYSRPVFDNSKQFAIVQWDNAHSGLGGGGAVVLYQFINDRWEELGNVIFWKY